MFFCRTSQGRPWTGKCPWCLRLKTSWFSGQTLQRLQLQTWSKLLSPIPKRQVSKFRTKRSVSPFLVSSPLFLWVRYICLLTTFGETIEPINLQKIHLRAGKGRCRSRRLKATTDVRPGSYQLYRPCGAQWLKPAWSSCITVKWWRVNVETQCSLFGLHSTSAGLKAVSTKERGTTHPAVPWCTAPAPSNIARARHCGQGCQLSCTSVPTDLYASWCFIQG